MPMAAPKTTVEVDGRKLGLSNLDKVLYPESGTTKAEVIDYYTRIAPFLLPHLADRPLTRKRWPDGVTAGSFFEKNAPRGTPRWVRTVTLPSPGSSRDRETVTYVVCNDLPTVVWLATLAVLEMHVPQWRVHGERPQNPDRLVVDLDPGAPATVIECCQVALLLAETLADDGLLAYPKTSGSKGMQMYVLWTRRPTCVPYTDTLAGSPSGWKKSILGWSCRGWRNDCAAARSWSIGARTTPRRRQWRRTHCVAASSPPSLRRSHGTRSSAPPGRARGPGCRSASTLGPCSPASTTWAI